MKRPLANSAEAAVKAALNANKSQLLPPAHCALREGDRPFWRAIIDSRARDEWTPSDLVVGAQLARCMHDVELEQVLLDAESTVVVDDQGQRRVNPRVSVLEQLARREMALMRTLRMGGRISGDARHIMGTRRLERVARKTKLELEADDLLA